MSKFNRAGARPAVSSPVKTEARPTGRTYEGAPGFARDAKGELFLLAVANMVGEQTFYEKAGDRDDRYRQLVRELAVEDPEWTFQLLRWLRSEANMRSAPIVGAAEFVKARLAECPGIPHRGHASSDWTCPLEDRHDGYNRKIIDAVLQRADEPGELLAYWTSTYGRAIPKPVKRGLADAVQRLYTERSLLKYDATGGAWRFGDVIDLVHPSPRDKVKIDTECPTPEKLRFATAEAGFATLKGDDTPMRSYYCRCGWYHQTTRPADLAYEVPVPTSWQGDLFAHALDRRHGRDKPIPESLGVLEARAELMALPVDERRRLLLETANAPELLRNAGITWEALAGWLQGPMDAKAWETVIPSMGYMALLRNLRNFDEAGVSDQVAEQVAAKLADPEQVAKSRQFPFRFFSAYLAAPSLRWGHALDKALTYATRNVPEFRGRTLVLVDTSASMSRTGVSERSRMTFAEMAALFGVALAARGNAVDLHGFADHTFRHDVSRGASVLREVDRFVGRIGEVGHGTQIAASVKATYRGHDRVIILSDMQTMGGGWGGSVTDAAPAHVPMYGFNLAGYARAAMPTGTGNRHELGGMTDATFRLVPLLEQGRNADWPWLR